MLFHHDPLHSDDFLDRLAGEVCARMPALARPGDWAGLATERRELAIGRSVANDVSPASRRTPGMPAGL